MSDNIPTPPDGTEEEEQVITPPQEETPADETPADEEPEIPTGEPAEEPEVPAPAEPQTPSVEERYRASSSEGMILNSKVKNLESTLNQITSADTPTEAEILAEYPDYKEVNPTTQRVYRELLTTKKRQLRQDLANIQAEAERKWQADLRALVRKPQYAGLRNDEKFEDFVFQPKHQGVDIQTLADAYLVRTGRAVAPVAPAPSPATPPAKPTSSGLPRGSGGPRGPQKPAKLTFEQAKVLRETNWKEYLKQVKLGNIEELE